MSTLISEAGAVGRSGEIARRFVAARNGAQGLPRYPGDLPSSLDEAYEIQDAAIRLWPEPVIGWKVGRIHAPLSQRYGADRLAGPMFRAHFAPASGALEMPVFAAGSAAAEAEFLLRVGRAPEAGKTSFTLDEAAELIDAVHVGIEIASSPLVGINDVGPTAVVSDFGNNNGVLIGAAVPDWQSWSFEQWEVATLIDGEVVGTGRAAAFSDGVVGSARFLFELLAKRGIPVQPGQWVSSGAVTGVHDARPGQTVEARFNDGLALSCLLVAAAPEPAAA